MSAAVWPPITHEQLLKEEEETLEDEVKWLLDLLQENLGSLKNGLQECVALLAPDEPGTTLAISSLRSESVKGFVTRVGTRIVRGDIRLNLSTLPPPPSSATPTYPLHLTQPLPLPQLSALATLLNTTLDIIDITTWTGDPRNAAFISSQLHLLSTTIQEARSLLKGSPPSTTTTTPGCNWSTNPPDPTAFQPPLPTTLAPHFAIEDGALVLVVRTLRPVLESGGTAAAGVVGGSFAGLGLSAAGGLRARLGLGPRAQPHDEEGVVWGWRGGEVRVWEKVRVESQDPGLLAIGAKLAAVGREVEGWRGRVAIVRGEEEWEGEGELRVEMG